MHALERKIDIVIRLLLLLLKTGEQNAMTVKDQLDAILAEVHAESTLDNSLATLITQLQANAADPAALQAILDGLKANSAVLSAAVQSNGSGPAPVAAPVVDPTPAPAAETPAS
jgi:hypothetical protein